MNQNQQLATQLRLRLSNKKKTTHTHTEADTLFDINITHSINFSQHLDIHSTCLWQFDFCIFSLSASGTEIHSRMLSFRKRDQYRFFLCVLQKVQFYRTDHLLTTSHRNVFVFFSLWHVHRIRIDIEFSIFVK